MKTSRWPHETCLFASWRMGLFFAKIVLTKGKEVNGMTLASFPERCRESIRTVAERLNTDYESAYFAILFECVMTDLSPSDPALPDMIAPEGR